MNTLIDFTKKKIDSTARLVICIVLDALLFCAWIGVAFLIFLLSDWMAKYGFSDFFLNAFKWSSSGATFLLTLLYAINDIITTIKEIWNDKDKDE